MKCIHLTDVVLIGHLPSLKDKCPKCRAMMQPRPVEHTIVYQCAGCGYEAKETSSGMRADWELAKAANR